jgi:hypothetical protein
MAYQYDFFISYTHDEVNSEFVPEVAKYLNTYVANELARKKVTFFLDRPIGIPVGASWPQQLYQALAGSRALLAIWNPVYFTSDWCRREFAAMLKREGETGVMRTVGQPSGLVVPMRVYDGIHFPKRLRGEVQDVDFSDYWRVGFAGTPRHVEFQDHLQALAAPLADAIRRAPQWDPKWQTQAWLADLPVRRLHPRRQRMTYAGLD